MNQPTFAELQLQEPLLRAVRAQGYDTPSPIQAQAIPPLLEGRDLLGIAQTGTGKTAAFALPILDFLIWDQVPPEPRRPAVLVMTPTRELASQIAESFGAYGQNVKVSHTVVFGGVSQVPQVKALNRGVDVLVATPGRLLDLMEQGHIDLRAIEVFVLDEADRMLDMGFFPAVRKVIAELPKDRQSLLFSATMPDDIVKLANSLLRDPLRIEVTPPATTVELIEQNVYLVEKSDKRSLLGEILQDKEMERVLIFTRTKHGADRVVKHLRKLGESADAIHGDKSQGARERALERFRAGDVRSLVATDIAARGIDIRDITHVINFDLPNIPENYVHRIGRTARAGRKGIALSFCDIEERAYLLEIEKAIGQEVSLIKQHKFRSSTPFDRAARQPKASPKQRQARPPRQQRQQGSKGRARTSQGPKGRRFGRGKARRSVAGTA